MGLPHSSSRRISRFSTTAFIQRVASHRKPRQIQILPSKSLEIFRSRAFSPQVPAILHRGSFSHFPAIVNWVDTLPEPHIFRHSYLDQFGTACVPTEYMAGLNQSGSMSEFKRIEAPLSWFLAWASLMGQADQSQAQQVSRMCIAQAPLSSLPERLQTDVPMPEFVEQVGRGDVYADSIWLGMAPTTTPLHRDPNPNLLVQIAGRKVIRMLQPEDGQKFWEKVCEKTGEGWDANGKIRGDDMMVGLERDISENFMWGDKTQRAISATNWDMLEIWEGEIGPGDGIFIPTAWWHAVRGIGEGAVASVNWWFR